MDIGLLISIIMERLRARDVEIKKLSKRAIKEKHSYVVIINDDELFYLDVFHGRPPHYRPWAEVYSVRKKVKIGSNKIEFKDSVFEDAVLEALGAATEPGDRIFIEYLYDDETMRALELGVPPVATRLGYKLYLQGFRWFKDWYFPEGFMEGGPKLQAEKPLDKTHELRLISEICGELKRFVLEYGYAGEGLFASALERARSILSESCKDA